MGDISRNFQVLDPLDFIAQITQHIPHHARNLLRSYGFYYPIRVAACAPRPP
ncbi:MAG: transposase [Planctomycetes bacterium]|nr:transposase [Planctomycetota bacterium]